MEVNVNVNGFVLTEEERVMLIRKRQLDERNAVRDILLKQLEDTLAHIEKMGFQPCFHGGRYVPACASFSITDIGIYSK